MRPILPALAVSTALVVAGQSAWAQPSTEFQIVGMEIVKSVESPMGQTWKTKDASKIKGVLVRLKLTVPDELKLWTTDLALAYSHPGGKEDRAACMGLTTTTASASDDGIWLLGEYVAVTAKPGVWYLRALFPLENDVKQITLIYMRPVTGKARVARGPKASRTASAGAASDSGGATSATGLFESLPGVWVDTQTQTRHTIVAVGSRLGVSAIVDDDGEVFVISNVSWQDGTLRWSYDVPSTGARVNLETQRIDGDVLWCKWSGTHGSGTQRFNRVE